MTSCHLTPCLLSEVWINRNALKDPKIVPIIKDFRHVIINQLAIYSLMAPY